ncbi:hypothetical protein [Lacibacter sediminis]|uniref:Uncharacterized protein n=1 Tax=Lacibacter sediminis TaxID=2760713 RepID=A0A7G5XFN5_9BACT|nr:hypothetical protein [Lacibacter sediminis]QNA44288.1 hypothetical protein H4075_19830 [Lacibacter sediminis]
MANVILNRLAEELTVLENELHEFKQAVTYLKEAKSNVETAVSAVANAENYHLENLTTIQEAYKAFESIYSSVASISNKIDAVDFPVRLNSIESMLNQVVNDIDVTTKSTLLELNKASETLVKADFDGKFSKLEKLLEVTAANNKSQLAEAIEQSKDNTEKFKGAIGQMNEELHAKFNEQIGEFKSLEIPDRFERLQSLVTGLLSVVNSTQTRIDNLERNFMDRFTEITEKNRATTQKIESIVEQNQIALQQLIKASEKRVKTLIYVTWGLGILAVISIIFSRFLKF